MKSNVRTLSEAAWKVFLGGVANEAVRELVAREMADGPTKSDAIEKVTVDTNLSRTQDRQARSLRRLKSQDPTLLGTPLAHRSGTICDRSN